MSYPRVQLEGNRTGHVLTHWDCMEGSGRICNGRTMCGREGAVKENYARNTPDCKVCMKVLALENKPAPETKLPKEGR